MLPSLKQFKNWSLPSKYTAVGLLVTILFGGFSVYIHFHPTQVETANDILIKAQHPSDLTIEKVKFQNWVSDDDKYLTIFFKNMENTPVDLLIAKVLVGDDSFQFTPSKTFSMENGVRIKANSTLGIPLAMKREVRKALSIQTNQSIIGTGTSPKIPDAIMSELREKHPNQSYFQVKSLALASFVKFRGPFGDLNKKISSLYIYIDATHG